MSSPKTPNVELMTLPPMTDPDAVQEVFANDVVIQVRQGAMQLIFCSIQATDNDQNGKTIDRRIVRSRVALPIPVSSAMIEVCRQLSAAIKQHETVATLTRN